MSNVDVLPLHMNASFGFNLPNGGRLTFYDSQDFSLVSGTKAEWTTALQFCILFLHMNRNREFSHVNFVALLKSRLAVVQPEVARGCAYTDITTVPCPNFPNGTRAVKFSGQEKEDCILGGWLESELKARHGKLSRLSFRFVQSEDFEFNGDENFDPYVHQDPHLKLYQVMTPDNVKHVEAKINGELLGMITDVYETHRSRVELNFMERLYNQCQA